MASLQQIKSNELAVDEKPVRPSSGADTPALTDQDAAQSIDKEELAVAAPDVDTNYLTGVKLVLVMIALIVVMFLSMLDISIIGTAIPRITSDFHRLEDVGWYIGAYQLASATLQPLTGKMYTFFSVKWTFISFLAVFEIGSALCGAAQSSAMLCIGRAIAGLGSAGLITGVITMILAAVKPISRPMLTGLAMGIGQIGIICGPVLGGIFTEHATWRWCFYINLPLGGLAALFLTSINIPDQVKKEPLTLSFLRTIIPRFDLLGFMLFAPAAVMLLLALQFGSGGDFAWTSATVIGLFVGSGATFIVFCIWEWRQGNEAMIPFPIIKQRIVWTSSLFFAFLMLTVIVGSNFPPIYFQSVKGLSPTMSGVYMLATIIPQIIWVVVSGALVTKIGYYMPFCLIAGALCAIGAGMITTWTPSSNLGMLLGYQVIIGARGAGMQMGMVAIQHHLPPREATFATSFLVFAQNIMGAIFVTIGNTIFQETLASDIRNKIPSLDPAVAAAAGSDAQAVRALAPPGPVRDALFEAYTHAFTNTFYIVVAGALAAFFVSFGMGWVDLRKPKQGSVQAAQDVKKASSIDGKQEV